MRRRVRGVGSALAPSGQRNRRTGRRFRYRPRACDRPAAILGWTGIEPGGVIPLAHPPQSAPKAGSGCVPAAARRPAKTGSRPRKCGPAPKTAEGCWQQCARAGAPRGARRRKADTEGLRRRTALRPPRFKTRVKQVPARAGKPKWGDANPREILRAETKECVWMKGKLIEAIDSQSSWPGLSRPSTSCCAAMLQGVDARNKCGHDGVRTSPCA